MMKASRKRRRSLLAFGLVTWAAAAFADQQQIATLVQQARVQAIHPQSQPPPWLEWNRLSNGLAFVKAHPKVWQIWGTTSLIETYAAQDIAPILIKTGRLVKEPGKRLTETGLWVGQMVQRTASQEQFIQRNYLRAYELGMLHAGLSKGITAESLGWSPGQRVTFNQQAYAFVLYTFAWEPIEEMVAAKEISPKQDATEIGDYLYLWRVLGYAMGVSPDLLPQDYERARQTALALRLAQYPGPSQLAVGVAQDLVASYLRITATQNKDAVAVFTAAITASPGLAEALGFTDDVPVRLSKMLPQGLTARQVIQRIKDHVGVPWRAETVDTFKAGDPDTTVTGIATTMMATLEVLQKAAASGENLVITHEPTFYNHLDETRDFAKETDAVWAEKAAFIKEHNLVVWRFHDHWHMRDPDGILTGMTRALEWQKYQSSAAANLFVMPETTLEHLVSCIQRQLSIRVLRVVGDPQMKVTKVALKPGASGFAAHRQMLQRPDVEVLIIGEAPEWETIEYVTDAAREGKRKALVILGHIPSEQAGMEDCAAWLRTLISEVPVEFIPASEPFWTLPASE